MPWVWQSVRCDPRDRDSQAKRSLRAGTGREFYKFKTSLKKGQKVDSARADRPGFFHLRPSGRIQPISRHGAWLIDETLITFCNSLCDRTGILTSLYLCPVGRQQQPRHSDVVGWGRQGRHALVQEGPAGGGRLPRTVRPIQVGAGAQKEEHELLQHCTLVFHDISIFIHYCHICHFPLTHLNLTCYKTEYICLARICSNPFR